MYGVRRGMARQGYGADVVSGGERERALAAGMAAEDIVFSGVGKTRAELAQGLDRGIGQFNIEHEPEGIRSEEHTSELQSLMRISYAVFCLKKKKQKLQDSTRFARKTKLKTQTHSTVTSIIVSLTTLRH